MSFKIPFFCSYKYLFRLNLWLFLLVLTKNSIINANKNSISGLKHSDNLNKIIIFILVM